MDLKKRVPVKDFPLLWKVYDHIAAHPAATISAKMGTEVRWAA